MNEITRKKTALVAYHANCIDGFTSAWVTFSALDKEGYEIELLAMNYDEDSVGLLKAHLNDKRYDQLWIVDYSLDVDVLEAIAKANIDTNITILDHHKTAFEKYNPGIEVTPTSKLTTYKHGASIFLDNAECGASVCYRYFHGNAAPLPKIIKYVKDYDLWRYKYGDETKHVNKYLRSYSQSIACLDHIATMMETEEGLEEILEEGMHLQKEHDAGVNELVAKCLPVTFFAIPGLCVAAPKEFSSDVGNLLAKKCKTFGATYSVDVKANKIHWSLRSIGDFDVSAIAKRHGGGGHKNAAGFSIERTGFTATVLEKETKV